MTTEQGAALDINSDAGKQELVERIAWNDQHAITYFDQVVRPGLKAYFIRKLGPGCFEDEVQDTILACITAIQEGRLIEPARLLGYVRGIAQHRAAEAIDARIKQRKRIVETGNSVAIVEQVRDTTVDVEADVTVAERRRFVEGVLARLSTRDRDILIRFYLYEQSREDICESLNLTEAQFRSAKSLAKMRFGKLGQRFLQRQEQAQAHSRRAPLTETIANVFRTAVAGVSGANS